MTELVRLCSKQLVELTNILDKVFPEFKPFFNGCFSATSLYILSYYQSPERIANMNSKSYDILRKKSRGSFTTFKFAQLKNLAKNTVGGPDDYPLLQIQMTLHIYSQLDSRICELDSQISECIHTINPTILTVPGIGDLSAAIIWTEFGDFARFDNPALIR